MLQKVLCLVRSHAKAIVGAVASLVAWLAARYAFDLPPEWQATMIPVVTALLVYLIPNRECEE